MKYKIFNKSSIFLKGLLFKVIIFNLALNNGFQIMPIFSLEESKVPTQDYLRQYETSNEYIIGPGDKLFIRVSEDLPEIDKMITVDGDGFAFLPRLKRIYISGLTVPELTNLLNKEYENYVFYPDVYVSIIKYRPIRVLVKGEVKSPGLHILPGSRSSLDNYETNDNENEFDIDIDNDIDSENIDSNLKNVGDEYSSNFPTVIDAFFPTLIDALRKSGGLKTNSDLSKIRIIRKNTFSNGGGRKQSNINLINFQNDDLNFQNNIRIYDGDEIIISKSTKPLINQLSLAIRSNINPKFLNIYVGGKVEFPGKITINRGATLNDALKVGGGKKVLSGKVILTRYNSDGNLERNSIRYKRLAKQGSLDNPYLENGDIIFVGKSNFNVATDILDEITRPFRSIVSVYGTYKIFND